MGELVERPDQRAREAASDAGRTGAFIGIARSESGRLRALFEEALRQPAGDRGAWVIRACAGDARLAARVERMLQADRARHHLLDRSGLTGRTCESALPRRETSGVDASLDPQAGMRTGRSHPGDAYFSPGEIVGGRFRIVQLCGQGGMGQVYAAEDLEVAQLVALKFLTAFAAPEQRRRLRSEVRLARQIAHPNVCRVYDIGEADGHLFVSMEYVRGADLRTLLQERGALPSAEALPIVRKLCAGLAAAHRKGILHRDLKPGNIMIDADGDVRIMDFGLASDTGQGTGVADPSGTPAYMAPEQLAGREATISSDVYAVGLIAYELVTGSAPVDAHTPRRLLQLRQRRPVPKPSRLVPHVPPHLDEAVARCLDPDPRMRPASADEIAASLADVDPPVSSGPASRPRRLLHWWRHGAAGIVAALALGGATAALWRESPLQSNSAAAPPDVHVEPLTLDGMAALGAISPDGSLLAYQPYGELSVNVRRLGDGIERPLVPAGRFSRISSLTVGPRSDFVDVVAVAEDTPTADLWRVPLGGTPRLLARGVVSAIGWAPDGRRMAYLHAGADDGPVSLVVANADGGGARTLATSRPPRMFYSDLTAAIGRPPSRPAWSPDSRSIVLAGYPVGNLGSASELVTVDAETGAERRITSLRGAWSEIAWLDGDRYLLIGGEHPHGFPTKQVWVSDPAGRHRTRVTREFGFFMNMTVTADRSTAVAKRFSRFSGIWLSDATGGAQHVKVPLSEAGAAHPRLDARGGLTYTALKPSGGAAVFHLGPGAAGPLELIESAPPPFAVPFHDVSADGRTVAYAELAEPHGLIRVRHDGIGRTRLVDRDVAIPRVTPDGREVLFTKTSSPGLYSVPTGGGAVRQLTDRVIPDGRVDRQFGPGFSISPDGRQVLLQTGRPGVLALCDLPDCTTVREVRLPSLNWAPSGTGVTFFRDSSTLLEQPIAGGPARVLATFDGDDRIIDLSWSPDGTRLATARGWYPNDMVIIRGLR